MPYGRDSYGKEIKKDLNRVFEKHVKNPDALRPNGSTCTNKSFNLLVASKVPKGAQNASLLKSKSLDFALLQQFAKGTWARLR